MSFLEFLGEAAARKMGIILEPKMDFYALFGRLGED